MVVGFPLLAQEEPRQLHVGVRNLEVQAPAQAEESIRGAQGLLFLVDQPISTRVQEALQQQQQQGQQGQQELQRLFEADLARLETALHAVHPHSRLPVVLAYRGASKQQPALRIQDDELLKQVAEAALQRVFQPALSPLSQAG